MNCPYCKAPQDPATGHCSTPGCGNLDIANCPTPAQAREQGYAQGRAAGLIEAAELLERNWRASTFTTNDYAHEIRLMAAQPPSGEGNT